MKIIDFPIIITKQDTSYAPKNSIAKTEDSENLKTNKDFNTDTISISNDAKNLYDEEKNLMLNSIEDESNMIAEMLRQLEEAKNSDNPHDSFIKCIQIAMRIMNGDKVPRKDEQFLFENQPQMYSNALLLRRTNDKPKKYDSIIEDEKDDTTDSAATLSFEAPSESSSETSVSSDNIEVSTDTNE